MTQIVRFTVLLCIILGLLYFSVVISHIVIKSKLEYKKALVFNLHKVRPMKKVDQYYLFFENLEVAKYNAWLAQKQYQKDTFLGLWIPKEITNEIPI